MASSKKNHLLTGIGFLLALISAIIVIMLMQKFAPTFNDFGADLPAFTAFFVDYAYGFFVLPLVVLTVHLFWPTPADRPVVALFLGVVCIVVVPVLTGIAVYLPIFKLGMAL